MNMSDHPSNQIPPSSRAIDEAMRPRAEFSGHQNAVGVAGFKEDPNAFSDREYLSNTGQKTLIDAPQGGFGHITIGAAWDNIVVKKAGLLDRIFKRVLKKGIDLDLGCLYELEDGTRGCIQAFGDKFGAYDTLPFLSLSGDEKTGNAKGDDEHIQLNGAQWQNIRKILVYVYIYEGLHNWSDIKPQIHVNIKGKPLMIVSPQVQDNELDVCAIAMLENHNGSIKLTNHTEYFPGHAEMDRAFGFGLEWADGRK